MSFATGIKRMDADLIKTFGEYCTYEPVSGTPSQFYGVIEYELSSYTQITDIISGGVIITCLVSDMPDPKNGDKLIDQAGNHWKILRPLENDDSVISVTAVRDPRYPELT